MPLIREVIVSTIDGSGRAHLAPIGLIEDGAGWIIAPFRPSRTGDNLAAMPFAAANFTDDAAIFAGLITNFPCASRGERLYRTGATRSNASRARGQCGQARQGE